MMVQLQPEWGWGGWRYGEENASGKKEEEKRRKKGAKTERIKLVNKSKIRL